MYGASRICATRTVAVGMRRKEAKACAGTFLLVYAFFWCFAAVPIFLLEVTVGQHLQRGGIEVWNLVPIFKGGSP
jgi:hypothetical protein